MGGWVGASQFSLKLHASRNRNTDTVTPKRRHRPRRDVDGTRRFVAFYKSFARDTTELIDAFEAFQLSTEGPFCACALPSVAPLCVTGR